MKKVDGKSNRNKKKEDLDLIKVLPGVGSAAGAVVGYKNPGAFDPGAFFPSMKKKKGFIKSKKGRVVSSIIGAGAGGGTASLPYDIRQSVDEMKKNASVSLILARASRAANRGITKEAALGQRSTATQDFVGGFDPTGSFTSSYGTSNQAAGISEKDHQKSKALAMAGGAVGSGLALPMFTAGVAKAISAGAKTKGGIGARAAAAAKGFGEGVKYVPYQIIKGLKVRSLGAKAETKGGFKTTKADRKALIDSMKNVSLGNLLPGKGKGSGIISGLKDAKDIGLLATTGYMTSGMGKKVREGANAGLMTAAGGLGLGAAVGSIGAGIQYDKGRGTYEDTVSHIRGSNKT